MLYILSPSNDPYVNIASEELLLRNFSDDIFMLYRNEPSIIVGKHQNTFAEINYRYAMDNNIKVIRRLSGGGTVFHDMGNLNFTFIQNSREGSQVDFVKFTEPILQALLKLGVPASRSGRNDLLAEDYKISGNAEHVYKNRTLHHGTLLFSSELDKLSEGLKVKQDSFTDKAVRSVRSKVTNISNYLPNLSINQFIECILHEVKIAYPHSNEYYFTEPNKEAIQSLITTKYNTWEWNFGYSPKFTAKKVGLIDGNPIEIEVLVEKGIIQKIESGMEVPFSITQLTDFPYQEEKLFAKLSQELNAGLATQWVGILFG